MNEIGTQNDTTNEKKEFQNNTSLKQDIFKEEIFQHFEDEKAKEQDSLTITNNNEISKSVFINENHGDISINSLKKEYNTPTPLILIENENIKYQATNVVKTLYSELFTQQLSIINCPHHGIAKDIKHQLAALFYKDKMELYEIASCNDLDIELLDIISHCETKINTTESSSKIALFIHDNDNLETAPLLKSLSTKNSNGKKDLIDKLKLKDIYVVYITYHANEDLFIKSELQLHTIDAFTIYTKAHRLSDSDIALFIEQQKKGYWTTNIKDLLSDFDKHDDITKAILTKNESKKDKDFFALLRKREQPLNKYLLFVASFFRELPSSTFSELVELLIEGKTGLDAFEDKAPLIDIWEEDSDFIIEDCNLKTFIKQNQYVVDFDSSIEAETCKRVMMSKTTFVDKQARKLIEHKKLFYKETALKTHYSIFPLIGKLVNHYKDYYGYELLKKWLYTIQEQDILEGITISITELKQYRSKIKPTISTLQRFRNSEKTLLHLRHLASFHLKEQYDELLKNISHSKFLFFQQENLPENISTNAVVDELNKLYGAITTKLQELNTEKNRCLYLNNRNVKAFTDLLIFIAREDTTATLIPNFFKDSFNSIYNNYIIIDILNKYQKTNKASNFLVHYEKTLRNSNNKTSGKALFGLIEFLSQSSEEFHLHFNTIKQWFPTNSKDYKSYNNIEENSIWLIHILFFETYKPLDKELIKQQRFLDTPSYNALFKDHWSSNTLQVIITHFLKFKDFTKVSNSNIYQLLIHWFMLLKQLELNHNTKNDIQKYIEVLTTSLNSKHLNDFIELLSDKQMLINKAINNTINKVKETQLLTERSFIAELTILLKTN